MGVGMHAGQVQQQQLQAQIEARSASMPAVADAVVVRAESLLEQVTIFVPSLLFLTCNQYVCAETQALNEAKHSMVAADQPGARQASLS